MIRFDSTADVKYGPTNNLEFTTWNYFDAANTLSTAGTGYWNALDKVEELAVLDNGNENHVVFLSDGCPTMAPTGSWYENMGQGVKWIFSKVAGFVVGGWVEVRYDPGPPSKYYTRDWITGIAQAIIGGISSLVNAKEPSLWVSHFNGGMPVSLWGDILDICNTIKGHESERSTLYTISFCSDGAQNGLGAMSSNGIAYRANDESELSSVITAICDNFETTAVDTQYTSINGLISLPDNNVKINISYEGEITSYEILDAGAKGIINGITLDLNKLYNYLKEQGKIEGITNINIEKL